MIYIHPKTKLLIFDCDGTIADNMAIHNQSWEIIATRYQIKVSPDKLPNYNGMPTINVLRELTKNMDLGADLKSIVDEKEALTNQNIHQAPPIEPIIEAIKYYYKKKMTLVVFSGGTSENVNKTLSTLGIRDLFTLVVTADDDHPAKDSHLAFTKIADRFNVCPTECHVFEDGKLGLINAVKAGMMVTDVRTLYDS